MQPSREISRLIEIMAALRDPETGCPWDIEQDFRDHRALHDRGGLRGGRRDCARRSRRSARRARRSAAAGRLPRAEWLRRQGDFAFGDVVQAITEKMIRRHPHVFGDEKARSAGMAKGMWEKIKAEEKAAKRAARVARGLDPEDHGKGFLDGIAVALPALTRALKLQQKAAQVGFDWGEAGADPRQDRGGDRRVARGDGQRATRLRSRTNSATCCLRWSISAAISSIDAEAALAGTNEKFRRRFHHVERALTAAAAHARRRRRSRKWKRCGSRPKARSRRTSGLLLRRSRLSISSRALAVALDRDR